MLKALAYSKTDSTRLNFESALKHKGVFWVDALNPTKEELSKLKKTFDLSQIDLSSALDESEIARVIERDKYSLVIIQSPLHTSSIERDTETLGIFILRNVIITVHHRKIASIQNLFNSHDLSDRHINQFIYKILRGVTNEFFKLTTDVDDEIEKLEEKVYNHPSKEIAKNIFNLKKTLIFFHRALTGNREVLSAIKQNRGITLAKKELGEFEEVYTDINQLISMIAVHQEVLSGALEIHASAVANSMNEIVKKLTILASFTMVPVLIASVYGMNFGQVMSEGAGPLNMPELAWFYGYPFALLLMFFSVIGLWAYFKKKKWL